MTSILKGAASGLALAVLLTGVASAQSVLRLDEVPVGELDPAKASDYADSVLMFNTYDTLVMPAQGAPGHVPHLATAWEAEGSTFTFTLRDDVSFHSGNPMTAADVVYSVERMQALEQGLSFLFTIVEAVEAVDDTTVRFTLSEPYAPFVASLTRLPIIDSVTVMANETDGDMGAAFLSANSAGTGAYIVESHNPQEQTVLVKNPDYFLSIDAGAPDEVRMRYGLEAATVRALVTQGEHDITSQWLPPEVLRALADDGAQLLGESGTGAFYIKLNTTLPPLDDVNCRLALASAFDYSTALAITQITPEVSGGVPSTGAIPGGMFGANGPEMTLSQDMDAAMAHLENCAYDPAEHTLEITWVAEVPIEERFALLMQSNFSELGFDSEIVRVPWVLFTERVTTPESTPHISQVFVNAVTGDPDTLLYPMYHSSASGTWQSPENLSDPEVDALLEAGRTAASEDERQEAYAALNDRLMALAPTIYGYDRNSVFAANADISVPALSDPAAAFGLDSIGFTFRLMDMGG
ncbi:MAG: ABC transporter substrate-binding protein [Pseudomonadota bacterium]